MKKQTKDRLGTIRAGEARAVVRDLIESKKVSKATWGFRDGQFVFLVGSREIAVPVPAGLPFYGLRDTLAHVERIIEEMESTKRHRNQLDIEDAIKGATP